MDTLTAEQILVALHDVVSTLPHNGYRRADVTRGIELIESQARRIAELEHDVDVYRGMAAGYSGRITEQDMRIAELETAVTPRRDESNIEWTERIFAARRKLGLAVPGSLGAAAPPSVTQWQPIETAPSGLDIVITRDDGSFELIQAADNHDYQFEKYTGNPGFGAWPTHWMQLRGPAECSAVETGGSRS